MSIQKVSSANVKSFNILNNYNLKQQINTTKTATKPDTFEKSAIDKEYIRTFLKDTKNTNGKPLCNTQDIKLIVKNVEKNPEKFSSIKILSGYPNIKGNELARLSSSNSENLEIIANDISTKTNAKNKRKYSARQLINFAELNLETLKKASPLTDTSLSANDIIQISNNKNINTKKLSKKIIDVEDACGKDKLKKVTFGESIYSPDNSYVISGHTNDDEVNTALLDKNLNTIAVDRTSYYLSDKGNSYEIRKTNDYRNNTTSMVRSLIDDNGYPSVQNQVRIIRDKNNQKIKTEYMTPSEVKGVYDIKNVYPDGKVEQISSGKIDKKTGIVSVKRDMKSLDGTRTQYLYENDPQGNRIIDYKITDEKGKVLLDYSQSFEVLDDNHFVSSKNNEVYDIIFNKKQNLLKVKDRNSDKTNIINLGNLLRGDKNSMISLLKKFPGEELINLKDTTKILYGAKSMDDCAFDIEKKRIDVVDDLYSVLHELGHAKDFKTGDDGITSRKDVQEIFDKEREAFNNAFPNAQRDHINYFIDIKEHYSGFRGGLEETVAESNALLNSYNEELDIAARAQYMQQYFPKTIAKLATILFK